MKRIRSLLWSTPGYRQVRLFPIRVRGRRFDALNNVRTAGVVDFADLDMTGINIEHSYDYEAIDPKLFRKAVGSLDIRHEYFVFVDFGSGMGRAVLLASEFPFREVVGVEFSPELHAVAEENIRCYKPDARRCRDVRSVCADALEYAIPEGPSVLFFYNPFKEKLLADVLENIRRSLERTPREVRVIYVHPKLAHLMDNNDMLTKVGNGKVTAVSYIVYKGSGRLRRAAASFEESVLKKSAAVAGRAVVEQGTVNG
ncbi:MAG TPA: class I SAM-dependent methyltransferase [Pyrinomonadaceae bacterium]|nr:class I SAM-dependent methyltransferase [Pyrinomonadaceae bacterium]